MLGMRKTAALLGKQRYAGTVQEKSRRARIKIESKLAIKSKIQEITSGVTIKSNMCYMLHQAKIIHEY